MKNLEDCENLSWEELEAAALQQDVPVPDSLRQQISERLAASECLAPRERADAPERFRPRKGLYAALAAAAALALLLTLPRLGGRELQDTFDDPYLAYAEVEKAFQQISSKMAVGVELAREVQPTADRPRQILEKINQP